MKAIILKYISLQIVCKKIQYLKNVLDILNEIDNIKLFIKNWLYKYLVVILYKKYLIRIYLDRTVASNEDNKYFLISHIKYFTYCL